MAEPAPKKLAVWQTYVNSGLAGCGATCVVHPADVVKTRLQLSGVGGGAKDYTGMFDAFIKIFKHEGPLKLYSGLSAGLFRQITYTMPRLGLFDQFKTIAAKHNGGNIEGGPTRNVPLLALCAATAGGLGAFVGTPAEVALIRMSADGKLPAGQRRNYTWVGNALTRVVREEGIATLWRGCAPTIGRAVVLNIAQLMSNDLAKDALCRQDIVPGLKQKNTFQQVLVAGYWSGLVCTVASMPLDIAKTRLQTMKPQADGVMPYRGLVDALVKIGRNEGILAYWKGFAPYFLRLGNHTAFTFLFLEELKKLW